LAEGKKVADRILFQIKKFICFVLLFNLILTMYDPILIFKKPGSEEELISLKEIEATLMYGVSQGLSNKQFEDILYKSCSDIKKWKCGLYAKTKLKFHTESALVGWMIENGIYFEIKEWAKKTGLEKKVEMLKQKAAYILLVFFTYCDWIIDLV
jgi:hypothetical protein